MRERTKFGPMYTKDGGPTRYQNKTTSFDDIEKGEGGAEFLNGFDLNARDCKYLKSIRTLQEFFEFFENIHEDIGTSANFQQHAPENIVAVTSQGGSGLSRAIRGCTKDDSWDNAYQSTVTNNFLQK